MITRFWQHFSLILLLLFSCTKNIKTVDKIDFLCDECSKSNETPSVKKEQAKENDLSEEISKAPERKPLIFEYDYIKEELNVRTYEEVFDKAMQFYSNGDIETSAKIFKVLVENAPNQQYKEISMFNFAMSIERLGKENEALEIYEMLTKSNDYEIKEDAILRAARIKLAQGKEIRINLQDFSDDRKKRFAKAILFLDRTEKILSELLSKQKSLSIISSEEITQDNHIEAEKLKDIKKIVEGIHSDIDNMLINPSEEDETKTIIYLCRGNIYFIEAVLLPNTSAETVKEKVRKLINAQREYFSAVKGKQPWWMTAGVFKIGETYRYLFEDITSSPIPKEIKIEQEKQIYKTELLKEIKRALDLARDIYEKNINFSQKAKMKTVWITKSEEGIEKIKYYMELVQKFIEEAEEQDFQ